MNDLNGREIRQIIRVIVFFEREKNSSINLNPSKVNSKSFNKTLPDC